jgi:hypothetical protein
MSMTCIHTAFTSTLAARAATPWVRGNRGIEAVDVLVGRRIR